MQRVGLTDVASEVGDGGTLIDLSGRPSSWDRAVTASWAQAVRVAHAREDATVVAPAAGHEPLRLALADRLDLDPEGLVVLPSVRLAAILVALDHRTIVLERPTFVGIRDVLQRSGATVVQARWPELRAAAEHHSAEAVWITSPFRNPDGATLHGESSDFAPGQATVVQNETYAWWGRPHRRHPRAIAVGSLSKLAGPGRRLAYGHFPDGWESYRPLLRATRPPAAWQAAWAEFIRLGGMDALIASVTRSTREARSAFVAGLAGVLPTVGEPAAPFLVLRLPPKMAETDAVEQLRRRGVKVSPGGAFDCEGPSIRVAFTGVDPAEARRAASVVSALLTR
jgi:DNA-binding transcriptional MocR family regulator